VWAVARINHLVIDDFLPPAVHADWLAFALEQADHFTPALVREEAGGQYAPGTRRSLLFADALGVREDRFVAAITARHDTLFAETGTPPFPVAKHEIELAVHLDGCFFAAHQDTFTGQNRAGLKSDRLISAVYYFHDQPKGFSGGELALYPFGGADPVVIEPRDNRLVAFPSFALHEVRPVHCPGDHFAQARFSINCWLRRARNQ
jgi:Rps23 Pro-64 3,4-dihydroxylase Tpa1-like proline 4-hydroxylase